MTSGAFSWDTKDAEAICYVSMAGIDEKLSKIIKELDKQYGINTRETALRYLVKSYQLTKAEPK
jgi:hypothetical protein